MTKLEPPPTPAQIDIPPLDPLKRYSPDEVYSLGYLPYTARVLREKSYKRELYHHKDGGRITFTAEDILRNSRLGAVEPFSSPKPARTRSKATPPAEPAREPARAA
ncbi:hypothetical protein ACIHCX_03070 [Streptomyces sp. NPDC052043]|uniref:hypothetical protein n=1 Tax=Streptomyces sp. NPDC052043 TaxID=3365684 RepID=UPI0037D6B858